MFDCAHEWCCSGAGSDDELGIAAAAGEVSLIDLPMLCKQPAAASSSRTRWCGACIWTAWLTPGTTRLGVPWVAATARTYRCRAGDDLWPTVNVIRSASVPTGRGSKARNIASSPATVSGAAVVSSGVQAGP